MGTATVDDSLAVTTVPGIDRTLANNRIVEISGKTLLGVDQTEHVRVAEVGPLLVLKLNAFSGPVGRKAPKDSHDILYLAMNYLDGTSRAVAAFQEEKKAGNRGMPYALNCLENDFSDTAAQGPLSCAAFRLDNQHLAPEFEAESMRIRQQCVTLAQVLLA